MAKININFTKDNEYYTPRSVVDFFGKFEYDPATTPEKAKDLGIPNFDTIETDGLKQDWTKYKRREIMKVLLLRGLPASGKSTYAKELVSKNHNWVRVNKDDLRAMMNNGEFSWKLEKQIVKAERELAENALKLGKNVIVDDTNFNPDM